MYSMITNNRNNLKKNRNMYNIDNLVGGFLENFFDEGLWPEPLFNQAGFRLDIRDNGDAYLIEADLPGVERSQIDLEYKDERLMILVNQEEEKNEDEPQYIHRERIARSMGRSLYLKDIDASSIDAELKDGVLYIKASKTDKNANTYRIEVK
ncbi:MAG: Hsp20 family protein [Vallitaleaceae bacterium]|jgi:HSP20 family protein|nr:Hsp20 family protein [Vallitaleaceae bacterium]